MVNKKTQTSKSSTNLIRFMKKHVNKVILVGIAVLLIVVVLGVLLSRGNGPGNEDMVVESSHLAVNPEEIKVLDDGTKYIVHPDDIRSGGPPKDGIPSIDNPKYVEVEDADDWIDDDELIATIEYEGIKRAYPFQILVWHEIVNDKIAGDPVLVTYCPLCGSVVAYDPHIPIDGELVASEFGTSGKLYNSNLVMYDRQTDTYWSQIGGRAIVGPLTGVELEAIDTNVVTWKDYKDVHPDAQVLSQDTGFSRDYGRDPYSGYTEDAFLIFPVEEEDTRTNIFAKDIVYGIEVEGTFKAYLESDVEALGSIEDTVNDVDILVSLEEDGGVTITNTETGDVIPKERDMWFAWYAFHPDTKVYGFDEEGNRII